jgi:hypothetical protein
MEAVAIGPLHVLWSAEQALGDVAHLQQRAKVDRRASLPNGFW